MLRRSLPALLVLAAGCVGPASPEDSRAGPFRIEFVKAPAEALPGAFEVFFLVHGEGTSARLEFGPESDPLPPYAYPSSVDASSAFGGLPIEVDLPSGRWFYRVAVETPDGARWSGERSVVVDEPADGLVVVRAPEAIHAGEVFQVVLESRGIPGAPLVAASLVVGDEVVAGPVEGRLPGPFVLEARFSAPGEVLWRALAAGEEVDLATEPRAVRVLGDDDLAVQVLGFATHGPRGEPAAVTWRVLGPASVEVSTSLHWGEASGGEYPGSGETKRGVAGDDFLDRIPPSPGAFVPFRVRAEAGGVVVWSPEYVVTFG